MLSPFKTFVQLLHNTMHLSTSYVCLISGRALYHNKDIRGSDSCFKVALQLLNDIPNNPAFRMASAYLNLIDRNSPVMNPRML